MATNTSPTLSGLSRILSNEPIPEMPVFRKPERVAPEMEQYVRNLHAYLKRLFGKFTSTNIITTINDGGGGVVGGVVGYDKVVNIGVKYHGTNTPVNLVLDSSIDWTKYRFDYDAAAAATYADLVNGPAAHNLGDGFYYPTSFVPDIVTVVGGDASFAVVLNTTTGAIEVNVTNVLGAGSSGTGYLSLILRAYGKVPASTDFKSTGNGL